MIVYVVIDYRGKIAGVYKDKFRAECEAFNHAGGLEMHPLHD